MRKPGAFTWRKLVSFEPEWLQSELELEKNWPKSANALSLARAAPAHSRSSSLVRWFSLWDEALAKRNGSAGPGDSN